ncbi:hypothetical protein CI238_13381, partial [Colletotrichum incanum]
LIIPTPQLSRTQWDSSQAEVFEADLCRSPRTVQPSLSPEYPIDVACEISTVLLIKHASTRVSRPVLQMTTCYEELQLDIPQLAIEAGKVQVPIEQKETSPTGDEDRHETDAKCFKFVWMKEHEDLWGSAFNKQARGKLKTWNESADFMLDKGVAKLERRHLLTSYPGQRSFIIPIGEKHTKFNILSPKGDVVRDLPWRPGLYYLLDPGVSIYTDHDTIVCVVVVVTPDPT